MIPRLSRAPHRHLRLDAAGRHPRRQCRDGPRRRALRRRHHRPRKRHEPRHRRPDPADVRRAQRAELAGRDRRGRRDGHRRRHGPRRRSPASRACKRRFTKTGEWNGVTDHRRLRPPSGRDRGGAARGARRLCRAPSSPSCSRTATPASPTCSRSSAPASTMPTPCWSPSLCRRRGADRGHRPRRAGRGPARARPSQRAAAGRARRARAARSPRSPQPGDFVVCLGAGSITQWAQRAARRARAAAPDAARSARMMAATRARAASDRPAAAGARAAHRRTRRSRRLTWFRVGGPAEVMFRPADVDDLARFLAAKPDGRAGDGDRRRLESAGARRRHRPAWWCGSAAASSRSRSRATRSGRRRRARSQRRARPARDGRHRRARIPVAAFPARSAARCA